MAEYHEKTPMRMLTGKAVNLTMDKPKARKTKTYQACQKRRKKTRIHKWQDVPVHTSCVHLIKRVARILGGSHPRSGMMLWF
ncbi:hypothetical protein GUITHDRAFT_152709 [Guillardia theta CCMP2712]|uniref:Uncharacterized protein n=1 Tax=Guillardia theta (strain CCMP2712) TaxID=905079 RepID=L1JA53_GUITC|nr:hypothetical protein GUITHDRAFT_152709 [Guillardia theta CCMP2712]EKX45396.1 hypothetical protein GUITHDRAFT_152709 [Guillardia theta CCMP2712]|mmetsp:Transcript_1036/g.3238  ORF Transcript_1036/g.3238 Transcript_1036/m.3238 type:complete len:82 (+) Transcript_1036:49-294(+)|eukprot:XP_005832376.1 hypothetical protein GUITHDRAFT_152709 [Guillardia theta CCMP2712]